MNRWLKMAALFVMVLMLSVVTAGCSVNEAYVKADAANFNATYNYTHAGINADTTLSPEDKSDLHLAQALRASRIRKNGGEINVTVFDPAAPALAP